MIINAILKNQEFFSVDWFLDRLNSRMTFEKYKNIVQITIDRFVKSIFEDSISYVKILRFDQADSENIFHRSIWHIAKYGIDRG